MFPEQSRWVKAHFCASIAAIFAFHRFPCEGNRNVLL
jgi:hypothetical protein